MSDRDWDRELADIDRRLAAVPTPPTRPPQGGAAAPPSVSRSEPGAGRAEALPPGTLVTPDTGLPVPPPQIGTSGRAGGRSVGTPARRERRSRRAQLALLFRVLLGVAAVAALVYWPYPARCGPALAYYLALVAALGLVGVTTATSAWRHRAAFVHLLGLAMLTGAAVLGAREVLPKVGYAIPTLAHPATWICAGA